MSSKVDRIYKIFRSNLDAVQTKELAKLLESMFTDDDLELIETRIDNVQATVISQARLAKKTDVEATDLAEKLKDYVVERYPYYEPTIKVTLWAKDIQSITKMNQAFNYAVIEAVMDWVFRFDSDNSNFWMKNIRSGSNFKKHFLRLLDLAKDEMQDSKVEEV